ncbi:MAG: hypothetical protein ACFFDN_14060 [Candidatus Hodarchaeota archaeon]
MGQNLLKQYFKVRQFCEEWHKISRGAQRCRDGRQGCEEDQGKGYPNKCYENTSRSPETPKTIGY